MGPMPRKSGMIFRARRPSWPGSVVVLPCMRLPAISAGSAGGQSIRALSARLSPQIYTINRVDST